MGDEGRGDDLARLRREHKAFRDALVAIAGPPHARAIERHGWRGLCDLQRRLARDVLREAEAEAREAAKGGRGGRGG